MEPLHHIAALFARCRPGRLHYAALRRFAGRHGTALLGLCCLAILWGGVLTSLAVQQQQASQAALRNTDNLAGAFEESILRALRTVDQTLRYARAYYLRDPVGFAAALRSPDNPFLLDAAFQVAIIGSDGYLQESNLGPTASRVYLGDREHFQVHTAQSGDTLFISKPVQGRVSGKWSVQITRPILQADGSFGGVVVVSLDPAFLTRFYRSVDLGQKGVALLAGFDGIIRARAAASPMLVGQSLVGGTMLRHHAQASSGHYTTTSRIDGILRFYSYREVEGLPLVVSVGMAEDEVMAGYRADWRSFITVSALVSLVLVIVIALIMRHEAHLERAREALRDSDARHAEKSHLLDTTLQNMAQGLVMVDARDTVQVINRRMTEFFGLAEHVATAGPTQQEMLRGLWQRGEFGAVTTDFGTW
jgi:hypothetical protein